MNINLRIEIALFTGFISRHFTSEKVGCHQQTIQNSSGAKRNRKRTYTYYIQESLINNEKSALKDNRQLTTEAIGLTNKGNQRSVTTQRWQRPYNKQ